MAWALTVTTGALTVLVVALGVLLLRVRSRLASVEGQLTSSDPPDRSWTPENLQFGSLDADPGYLITSVDDPELARVAGSVPVRVEAAPFTDELARESAVHLIALAHGVRRALTPETRHRIRFHMRQEVKRARKQRRLEMRVAHREWTARQRTAMVADEPAA